MEKVAEIDGVAFYNDSKSTTPHSTITALAAFSKPVILILGGKEKNLPFKKLAKVICQKAKAVFLIGETTKKWAKVLEKIKKKSKKPKLKLVKTSHTLTKALKQIAQIAKRGDVVLLSPATASYDQFLDFEDRGEKFKEGINEVFG